MDIFQISSEYCDFTEGQGHPRSHHFGGLSLAYLLSNFHNSAVHSVWDIANVKVSRHATFPRILEIPREQILISEIVLTFTEAV